MSRGLRTSTKPFTNNPELVRLTVASLQFTACERLSAPLSCAAQEESHSTAGAPLPLRRHGAVFLLRASDSGRAA